MNDFLQSINEKILSAESVEDFASLEDDITKAKELFSALSKTTDASSIDFDLKHDLVADIDNYICDLDAALKLCIRYKSHQEGQDFDDATYGTYADQVRTEYNSTRI